MKFGVVTVFNNVETPPTHWWFSLYFADREAYELSESFRDITCLVVRRNPWGWGVVQQWERGIPVARTRLGDFLLGSGVQFYGHEVDCLSLPAKPR